MVWVFVFAVAVLAVVLAVVLFMVWVVAAGRVIAEHDRRGTGY